MSIPFEQIAATILLSIFLAVALMTALIVVDEVVEWWNNRERSREVKGREEAILGEYEE